MTIEELQHAAEEIEVVEYDGSRYTVNALVKKIRFNTKGKRYWDYSVELIDLNRWSVRIVDPKKVSGTGEYTFPRADAIQYGSYQRKQKTED